MKYWADKGVDGFRLDAFQFVVKDTAFPPFPEGFEKDFIQYYAMQEGIHEYINDMYNEVFSRYDVMTVAEGAGRNFDDAHKLVDEDRNELNMAYAFDAVDIAKYEGYKLKDLKEVFSRWDSAFAEKGWLSIFLANHDVARLVSRYGNDSTGYRIPSAKMLNTFLLSMRGTPYCYFGDELGMTNIDFDSIDDYQDIAAINGYKKAMAAGEDMDYFMKKLNFLSRDNGRTPMQWDSTYNAGFTNGTPWLPVNENYKTINVDAEEKNPNSVLNHFRKMTQLRTSQPALVYGSYSLFERDHPQVYAYYRILNDTRLLVLLNFSKTKAVIDLEEGVESILINNYENIDLKDTKTTLLPYQGVILKLK